MPCVSLLRGYRGKYVNPETGKRPLVFNKKDGYLDLPVDIPCGQCWSCRLDYSRQWAIRCMHEAQMHEDNSFITLTYDQEHLPADHSIHKEELQNFFKKLRRELDEIYGKTRIEEKGRYKYKPNKPIRYFACGEYGKLRNRPHYHVILFGYDFPDRRLWTKSNGNLYYRSDLLERIWTKGNSLIGEVTFNSAAYVARYVMKKRKGTSEDANTYAEDKYKLVDDETGELHLIEPEFCLMSRRPGIAKTWYEKYKSDTHKDYLIVNGKKSKIPKYYDNMLEVEHPEMYEETKLKRVKKAIKYKEDNTLERLDTKQRVKQAQTKNLNRHIEEI